MEELALWSVVAVALAFAYTNGVNDAANSIATVVATRVLSPRLAVLWAAFFNFIAFVFFHTRVADTIATGVVEAQVLSIGVIFAGLVGGLVWNLVMLYQGLPVSSSHSLVGGIVGAAVVKSGFGVVLTTGLSTIGVFIVLAPLIGLALGFVGMVVLLNLAQRTTNVERLNRVFGRLQLLSAGAYSLGHAGNNAQQHMGVILALLIAKGKLPAGAGVPAWVVLAAHAAIAAGTLAGGWRVVHTLGSRITKLQIPSGLSAESAAAVTLFFVSAQGIPVSTTHTITGSIVGVGSVHRLSAVRWGVATRVICAWILTIPCAALIAGALFSLMGLF